jgi:diphthine synthase
MEELLAVDFGTPLHSFIVCGDCHDLELEVLKEFLVPNSQYVIDGPEQRENIDKAAAANEE